MTLIGVFPGSFDPPSKGHLDIIQRAALFCSRLIVAVAHKPDKKTFFSVEEKLEMLRLITKSLPHVEVESFHGLVTEFARAKKANFLVRGLRACSDFEYEGQMALANKRLSGIETVFLTADERLALISSSLIREIGYFGGPIQEFVPPEIELFVRKKIPRSERPG